MKKRLMALAILAFVSIGMVGCSDDTDTPSVQVNQYLKFNVGDKFTYNYYDRDASNAREDNSLHVLKWEVLRTGLTMFSRSEVSEIRQIRYEADGTTPVDTTMLYFVANNQGQLQQYNLLQTVVRQFSSSTLDLGPVISQMPDTWIQISDTKSPSALSWSFPEIIAALNDVPIVTTTLDATLKMSVSSSHKGKMATTVAAGTYDDAFVTDHTTPIKILAAEDKTILTLSLKKNDPLISDAVVLHNAVSISGGILSQSMDSKSTTLVPLGTAYPVKGFEMELTSVTRATTN